MSIPNSCHIQSAALWRMLSRVLKMYAVQKSPPESNVPSPLRSRDRSSLTALPAALTLARPVPVERGGAFADRLAPLHPERSRQGLDDPVLAPDPIAQRSPPLRPIVAVDGK